MNDAFLQPRLEHRTAGRWPVSNTLVVVGLVLTVLLVMFRPTAVIAELPAEALVYVDNEESQSYNVKLEQTPIQRDYDIVLDGKKTPDKISLTGIPLIDLLGAVGSDKLDPSTVPYLKVRFGNSDAYSYLIALNGGAASTPPPLVLKSGDRPGRGSFHVPAIVPGQPTTDPIFEAQMIPFNAKKDSVQLVPMKGKIFSVELKHGKRNSKGQIKYTAKAVDAPGGAVSYKWYSFDGTGNVSEVSSKSTWTTTNAKGTPQTNYLRVVVSTPDGSTGTAADSYVSSRTDDGAKTDPGYGNDTGTGTGTGTGNGTGTGTGTYPGTGTTPTVPTTPSTPPPTTTTTPAPTTPTPPTTTPTPETTEPTPTTSSGTTVDNSNLANIAQNYTSSSPMTTVNGVLLSKPTVAPTAAPSGGGGSGAANGLTPLQQSAASLAESIFQPVDDPGDLWPYLVTLLFALGLTGGVREWMNP
ncbi:MAG: hypothetical protein HY827_06990 [Actinobacteria bacterium]|nr:hypothetical protein [Actinomycetota bacterium]